MSGTLTVYIPKEYTKEDSGTMDFELSDIPAIVECYHHGDRSEVLGMNSNSFATLPNLHYGFLEWGHKQQPVNIDHFPGVVIETERGYHAILGVNLYTMNELLALQRRYKCCPGFINQTEQRGYACLRVSPKEESKLSIVHRPKTPIITIHEAHIELVEGLNKKLLKSDPLRETIEREVRNCQS